MALSTEQLAEIERKLDEACAWAVANGWKLRGDGTFGSAGNMSCCAVGALAAKHDGAPSNRRLLSRLGFDHSLYLPIGRGFDGVGFEPHDDERQDEPDLVAIGRRLRAKYLGTP